MYFIFYIFPFEKIERGSNIIIYGAGKAGKDYIAQIEKTKYCNIVCVLDKAYPILRINGDYPIHSPDDISSIQNYDYVLISVQLEKIAVQIREFLLSNGVPEEKILWVKNRFFALPDEMIALKNYLDLIVNSPAGGKESDAYKEFTDYVENLNYVLRNKSANRYFVEITDKPYEPHKNDTKLIAWYLPQFYKMDVNDKHHGLGFTEWTNTTRTVPLFTGHYQPRLPYDLGFYNLTDIETLKRQVELAKMYGIHGFAFHYYWFSGVKTMEKPVELFLEHKELDIKFCMHWCTENWTALWDGEDNALIFEQKLEDGDDEAFMRDILPYMKDERYIKIDGKPVLMIYRINIFEQKRFVRLMQNFRKLAKGAGFPDLYIIITTRDDFLDELEAWDADALAELSATSIVTNGTRFRLKGHINQYFYAKNNAFDVESYVNQDCPLFRYKGKNIYRSALVNFDSTPRKANSNNCWLTVNSTPQNYKKWLKNIINQTKKVRREEENYAFIFAWNEWAECAYLEPDMLYGYAYLQATKEALEETRPVRDDIILKELEQKRMQGINDFCFYIHCIESLGDIVACEPIARYLKRIEPGSKIVWIVKENAAELVQWNPNINGVIEVECLSESIDIINKKRKEPSNIIIDCHYDGRKCDSQNGVNINKNNPQIGGLTYLDHGTLLKSFCYIAGLPGLDDAPIFYSAPKINIPPEMPEKYVVFHCKSGEAAKDWKPEKWDRLAEMIISDGFSVIEVGLEPIIKTGSKYYHDCTGIKSIQSAAEIIKHSACFIGIDSVFAHISNCLNIYGILLFGKYRDYCRPMVYTGGYAIGRKSSIIYARDNHPAKDISEDDVYWEFKRAAEKDFN